MNPADTLELRDIHLPDAVSWWPPAPGWWVLLVLLVIILLLSWWLIRILRRPVLRKRVQSEIDALIAAYRLNQNKQQLLQQLSVTLRRIGISYLPRQQSAGTLGTDWLAQLNQLVDKDPLSSDHLQLLTQAPYQRVVEPGDEQIEDLLQQIQKWVKGLARGVKNV
jgi:Tfp pilus assembly protein PilO